MNTELNNEINEKTKLIGNIRVLEDDLLKINEELKDKVNMHYQLNIFQKQNSEL